MMSIETSPDIVKDIFLQPGEFFWGGENHRIKTLLGSCVSFVFWHPQLKIGGMCHFMLPENKSGITIKSNLNGKYADDAFDLFNNEILKNNTSHKEYVVKMFGGSNMFTQQEKQLTEIAEIKKRINEIGNKNIEKGRELANKYKVTISGESTGGDKHRKIYFNVWNGEVWMETKKGSQ